MAKLTETQRTLVILGSGVLVAVGAGAGIYFDLDEKTKVEEEIKVQEETKKRNQVEIDKIPGLKQQVVAYKEIVKENAKILPTSAEVNDFIRLLAKFEKESGVTIESLPPFDVADKKAAIVPIPIKLKLKGSTRSFLRFMSALESHERLVKIVSFLIAGSNKDVESGKDPIHDISIDLETYQYTPGAGVTPVPIPVAERDEILRGKEAKDLIAKSRPASIETYKLMAGKETRRDPFVDPRRSTVIGSEGQKGDVRPYEETLCDALVLKVAVIKNDFEEVQSATDSGDFLRRAAARRKLLRSVDEINTEIRKLKTPPFEGRDLNDRYDMEVRRPYDELSKEIGRYLGETGPKGGEISVTKAQAQKFVKDIQALSDARNWDEATEKFLNFDSFLRDVRTRVDAAAEPEVQKLRLIGEHVQRQAQFAKKNLVVQGTVRMGNTSAVILNGRTLFPGKNLDEDTVFVRVGDGGILVFKYRGFDVEYLPPKPKDLKPTGKDLMEE